MSKLQDIDSKLEALVMPFCVAHGLELVDVRFVPQKGGGLVRVLIDRARVDTEEGSGVSLGDCTDLSRDVSTALDLHEDIVPGSYRLEVGSPGLERPLIKLADFERFAGKEAKIKMQVPIEGRRRFAGEIIGVEAEQVLLKEEGGAVVSIPHKDIVKANLVVRF